MSVQISDDELIQLRTDQNRFRFLLRVWANVNQMRPPDALVEIDMMVAAGYQFAEFTALVGKRAAGRRASRGGNPKAGIANPK